MLEVLGSDLHSGNRELLLIEKTRARHILWSTHEVQTRLDEIFDLCIERRIAQILGQVEKRARILLGRLETTSVHVIQKVGNRLGSLSFEIQLAFATHRLCESRSTATTTALSHEVVAFAWTAGDHGLVHMEHFYFAGLLHHCDHNAPVRKRLFRVVAPRK